MKAFKLTSKSFKYLKYHLYMSERLDAAHNYMNKNFPKLSLDNYEEFSKEITKFYNTYPKYKY